MKQCSLFFYTLHLLLAFLTQPKKTDKAADLILEEYGKGLDTEDKYRWSRIAGNILGDTWFCYPGVEMAQAYSGLFLFFIYL